MARTASTKGKTSSGAKATPKKVEQAPRLTGTDEKALDKAWKSVLPKKGKGK
jgi:hypothetical protein